MGRIVGTVATPVSYNGSNIFEVMSNGTIKMAARRDVNLSYIRGATYQGEKITARDFQILAGRMSNSERGTCSNAATFLEMGHSNTFSFVFSGILTNT